MRNSIFSNENTVPLQCTCGKRDLQPNAPEVERLLLHVYEQLVVKQREVLQRQPQTTPVPSVAQDGRHAGSEPGWYKSQGEKSTCG